MSPKHHPASPPLLTRMSLDILSDVAFNSVSTSLTPDPRELSNLFSLVLVSRRMYKSLSPARNPDLYARIFRAMFDVDAAQKYLGRSITPRKLTSELKNRTSLLRRIRTLPWSEDDRNISSDLCSIFLMVLENEGKNMKQLQNAGISRLLDTLMSHALENNRAPSILVQLSSFFLLLPLIWTTESQELFVKGNKRDRISALDFLDPFVLQEHKKYFSGVAKRVRRGDGQSSSSIPVDWFGYKVVFEPPHIMPFARLCTATLFHMAKQSHHKDFQAITPNASLNASCSTCMSHRYEDDLRKCISFPSRKSKATSATKTSPLYSTGMLRGIWEGSFFIPVIVHDGGRTHQETCEVVMQCHLQEYYSTSPEESVSWDDVDPHDRDGLASAWIPKGTEWHEDEGSLLVYDPTKSRTLRYHPYTDDPSEAPRAFDTFIIGKSTSLMDVQSGGYTFYGRVRKDGYIALVRQPAQRPQDFLGKWVFYGQVHGSLDFVGDWSVTASVASSPGKRGWFKLSKKWI